MSCLRTLAQKLLFLSFFLLCAKSFADLASDTIYLTWQQDPTTTMTIQWVTSPAEKESQILFRPLSAKNQEWQKCKGMSFNFPFTARYLIHRVELTGLEPETDYLFQFPDAKESYQFRTMPATLDHPVRFVVGGDMYHDGIKLMMETCRQAAKTNPAFALLGGDIAYTAGPSYLPIQKIDRWIEWIKAWHLTMVTTEGRLIPVLAALGNHDLPGHFDQTPAQAKIFSSLFPMPGESLYNVLDFGTYLSLFILDSGHANPIGGIQSGWLQTTLENRREVKHRFAIYHVPAYPSIRDFDNRHSKAIRKYWVPLFEKEGLNAAFEHHDHAYKRTYPLLQGKIHPEGVLYLGDGAWGIEHPRKRKSKKMPGYLAKFASVRHFILVTLNSNEQHFMSIDYKGKKVDEYHQTIALPEQNELEVIQTF